MDAARSRADEPVHATGALPPAGARIGQYELIRELGRGGMGAVFLARDTKLGRRVAIKFLQSGQPELSARFILEARATARCNHENIVVIHEVDEHEGNPFMVLEYLQGSPLTRLIEGGRALPPNRAVEIMIPVVRALVRAHEHNIVHRDLKPDNIFVTDSGTVKVLDFGIAKLLQDQQQEALIGAGAASPQAMASIVGELAAERYNDESSNPGTPELTRRGAIVGTLPFMSPEQWGADTVDHRTDIWAVGIILFRMLAGRHPLAPMRGAQLMVTGVLDMPMPRVRELCPEVPDDLAAVIDRCLIKRKEQRMGSARQLLEALEALVPSRHSPSFRVQEAPYTGLASFQVTDAGRFFGRSREIAAVVNRLQSQPLIGVVGPSGVGKSSFVRAGVLPALKHSGESWSSVVVRPGREPVAALAQALVPMVANSATSLEHDLAELVAVQERLYAEPGYMGVLLRSRARHKGQKILVFVDQLEELYTLVADTRERMTFTRCLASAADDSTSPVRVVISIRSDFLDRVAEDEHFMTELGGGLFFLPPPNRAGLRDALILPAEMAGYAFESKAMVEHMLDHLEHTPGALPLLQFAATKLWELRDTERRLLTEAGYAQIGGITGALASHADSVVAELSSASQALARAVLLRLVTPERTRAIVSVDELRELAPDAAEVQRLIDRLVQARLLVVRQSGAGGGGGVGGVGAGGAGAGAASVEIVHESLVHSWPLLRRWLDENQDDAAFLEQLRNAAKQWQAKDYAQGLLWRGEAMEEARRWYRRYRGELPELQKAYLQAVFALSERAVRRMRYAVIGVIAFLSMLVAAGAVAIVMIRNAQKESAELAEMAQRSERMLREQLAALERERAAKEKAEKEAQAAKENVDEALRHAEQAKLEALAKDAAAREAEKQALQIKAELAKLLDKKPEATEQASKPVRPEKAETARPTKVISDIDIN